MTKLILMGLSILLPLALGIPIAVALGATGLAWLVYENPLYLRGVGSAIWNVASSYLLMSIPLFVLMGQILQRSLIAQRFYRSMSRWVGWLPGGLLHANIGACAVFSAVSGSSVATAATIGATAIPDLLRLGYSRRLTYGSLAAGGTLGILIPPSIPLIIYASLTNVSLGRLFAAALIPGIIMALIFSAYLAVHSLVSGESAAPVPPSASPAPAESGALSAALDVLPLFAIIAIIMVGVYTGWATPTEVAALGVAAALLVAALTRSLSVRMLAEATIASVRFTAVIVFVIMGAQIFGYALAVANAPQAVSAWVGALSPNPYVILLALVVMYLILGMFIDAISMMVLTIGVVFPIVTGAGFDPVWFGVILVILLEIGLLTPPVGINLFTIQGIAPAGTSLAEVAWGSLPFVVLLLLGIGILTLFPELALWLPSKMIRG